ncbi:MAG: tyrosine-type recombinase/integrase [Clostridia bacterium]
MAGSIIEIEKDKKYKLSYMYKGNRHYRTVECKTKDSNILLANFVMEIKNGNKEIKDIYFVEFSQLYLDNYAKPTLANKTVWEYKKYLNKRICPYFEKYLLKNIETLDVQNFINLLGKELSRESVKRYKSLLSGIFDKAILWGFLKANPCKLTILPKCKASTGTKSKSLDLDTAKKILELLDNVDKKHKLIMNIILRCGLRRSEVLGLKYKDIDFVNNILTVNQVIEYIPHQPLGLKPPKTERGHRKIHISTELSAMILDYRTKEPDDDLIFNWYNPDALYKWFKRFLNTNKLQDIRLHDLRHTYANIMINDAKISIASLSELLGHSRTSTTQNIYIHSINAEQDAAAIFFDK